MNDKKYIEDMISVLGMLESGATVSQIKEATPYAFQIIDELKERRALLGTADGFILDGDFSALILQYKAELDSINREEADRILQRESAQTSIETSKEAVRQSKRANTIAAAAMIIALASLLWQALR